MKITLHLAISADGFIAQSDGNSDWVSSIDEVIFKDRSKKIGCIVVGNKTFKQYQETIYPIKNITNIVLSKNPSVERNDNVFFVTSPEKAVKIAEENGYSEILVAGGGQTSTSFLKMNLINEIFFSIHPLFLGQGIRPFEGSAPKNLKLLNSQKLGDEIIEVHYKVLI